MAFTAKVNIRSSSTTQTDAAGAYWTNIYPGGGETSVLLEDYDTGTVSSYTFTPGSWGSGFSGGPANFTGIPSNVSRSGISYAYNATTDNYRTSTVTGLDNSKYYTIRIGCTYAATAGLPEVIWSLNGSATQQVLPASSTEANTSTVLTFSNIQPSSGVISFVARGSATGTIYFNWFELDEVGTNHFDSVNSGSNEIVNGSTFTIEGTSLTSVTGLAIRTLDSANTDTVSIDSATSTLITTSAYTTTNVPFGDVEVYDTTSGSISVRGCIFSPESGFDYVTLVSPSTAEGSILSLLTGETPATGDQIKFPVLSRNGHTVTVDVEGFPEILSGTGTDYIDGIDYWNGTEWVGSVNVQYYDGVIVINTNLVADSFSTTNSFSSAGLLSNRKLVTTPAQFYSNFSNARLVWSGAPVLTGLGLVRSLVRPTTRTTSGKL